MASTRRARFASTLFLGAALLFVVEPMVAKLLMPLLGGAPAVWITCMLFFQAALLLGYAYAHAATAWLGVRRQAALHLVVLALPLLVLPIRVREGGVALLTHGDTPVLSLLRVLVTVVGVPFFVVGATAPLVQRWFSATGDDARDARDPYFLYSSSNLGSLLALAAYPAIVEPWIGLNLQTRLWTWGYVALAVLVGSCALTALVRTPAAPALAPEAAAPVTSERLTIGRRARWVLYAFVPSSLLLGVTAYLTTDVAPIPLFWVVPLAVYLVTFILVFARRPLVSHALMVRALPFGVTSTVMLLLVQASTPMVLIAPVHLATFFLAAMVCHGELAKDRPSSDHLTEFYLWVSVGGVLGGVANGLVAPVVFDGLAEYPIALVLAAACRRVAGEPELPVRRDGLFAGVVLALTFAVVAVGNALHLDPAGHMFPLLFAFPLFLTYSRLAKPWAFAMGLAATLVGGVSYDASIGRTVHVERSFFGVVRVTRDAEGRFTQIAHGNTIHGRQWRDVARRDEPTAYYTHEGPLGQVFAELHARERAAHDVARAVGVIGLGAGAMATYARPDEAWTFYEINPVIVKLATDPAFFTFLADTFGGSPRLQIVVGDARLRLAEAPPAAYDLLVVDAFSSDTIPAHLLTREAFALYLEKLRPNGLLVVHISNRYLDLAPVLSSLARDAHLAGYVRSDGSQSPDSALDAAWSPSIWTAMTREGSPATILERDPRWTPFAPGDRAPWTDDFSDLVRAFRR